MVTFIIDASKAFDPVYYGRLFTLLLSKHIPVCIRSLVFDSYNRQETCVLCCWIHIFLNDKMMCDMCNSF